MAAPDQGGHGGLSTVIPRRYRKLVDAAAQQSGVPLKVIAAQIDDESGWNPTVTSPTGAQGIAQFEPGTWASWGHGSPDNPADAFPAYGRLMGHLLNSYHGDIRDALAAYNAGPGNLPAGYGYADTILAAAGVPQGSHSQAIPYRNPLRGVSGLVPERVDMGVDYSGSGPVYALGPGVITSTQNAGWPGGGFIAERLTAGPLAGHYVYMAENVSPAVRIGDHVTADTEIGQIHGGIETGFASPPGTGNALGASQFTGNNATAYGAAYSKILARLGAPPGTVSGTVSGSNPSWLDKALSGIENFVTGTVGGVGSDIAALGGIGSALGSIAKVVTDAEAAVLWLVNPSNWVRILCGFFGTWAIVFGVAMMARTGRPNSVNVPQVGPVPYPGGEIAPALGIALVTIGAVFLFFAFHNLQNLGITDLPSLLGYIHDQAHGGGATQKIAGGQ